MSAFAPFIQHCQTDMDLTVPVRYFEAQSTCPFWQVMLTQNEPSEGFRHSKMRLVNGSRGVVRRFEGKDDALCELQRELDIVEEERRQYFASGGGGKEELEMFEERRKVSYHVFLSGQTWLGVVVIDWLRPDAHGWQEGKRNIEALKASTKDRYPVVWFEEAGREKVITPVEFDNDVYMTGKCIRNQVPSPIPNLSPPLT